jgi:pimeloyl-ACP methyl ester carboxylesterase
MPLAGRYTLIAFDIRAHGATRVHSGDYSNEVIIDDLRAVLDFFEVDRAALAGYSMGAGLAVRAAPVLGDRATALVLLSFGGNSQSAAPEDVPRLRSTYNADQEYLRANGLAALLPSRIRRMFTGEFAENAAEVERYSSAILRSDSQELSKRPLPDLEADDLASLDMPVLVLAGEDDQVFPPDRGREAAATMPSARFELLVGGHASYVEFPDEFNRRVLEFLDAIDF